MSSGILFAICALFAWAFDDFYIGRATKKIQSLPALLGLSVLGLGILTPFVLPQLVSLSLSTQLWTALFYLVLCTCVAAYADFEALRLGKLSVIDALYAFEIPITAILAFAFLGERLSPVQICLVVSLVTGMLLVATKNLPNHKTFHWEKGIGYAIISILCMGAVNFLIGYSARLSSPLLVNWISYLGLALFSMTLLSLKGVLIKTVGTIRENRRFVIPLAIGDVIAWSAFAYSTTRIPIGIATAISETYILVAIILGLTLNKERITTRQVVGICITLTSGGLLLFTLT